MEPSPAAGSLSGLGTYLCGETITLKATANEGYVFLGWFIKDAHSTVPEATIVVDRGAIQNSTFAHNVADGGGFNSSGGGGILNYQGGVTITNSTFMDNVCVDDMGGAIYNAQGTVRMTNVTFADNRATAGGSIANADTLMIQNSLITDSPTGGNCSGMLAPPARTT